MKASVSIIKAEMEKMKSRLDKGPKPAKPNTFDKLAASATPSSVSNSVHTPFRQMDSKFNIVIFGIPEKSGVTSRTMRSTHDLEAATEIVSGLDSSISSNSIRDSFRLGKFSKSKQRPRPLLVKFLHSQDVNSVLSKRRRLNGSIKIKLDVSLKERATEAILLKERWHLIQNGFDRLNIRIRNSRLYVMGKMFGEVKDLKFVKSDSDSTANDDHRVVPRSVDNHSSPVPSGNDNSNGSISPT